MISANTLFDIYKRRLLLISSQYGYIRFIVIQYLCQFPKISAHEMAASLARDEVKIVYDDSTISKTENERHRRAVNNLLR